jgi:hypothetical protein
MHRILPALVLAVLLLCGLEAAAVTLASRFPAVSDEIAARLAALPASGLTKDQKKLKSTLGKAAKALAKDTDDLALTLKYARKAVLKIDTAYPGDETFAPLLDELVAGLALDVTRRGGDLYNSVQALPDGDAKTKAQALSDASEAEIVAAVGALARADALSHLAAANALIAKGQKVVRKAGGGTNAATNEIDVDIDGNHLHLPPVSGDYTYTTTYDPAMDVFILSVRGTIDTTTHLFSLRVLTPGLGPHPIQAGPNATYTSSAIVGGPPFVMMQGATMDFSTWDPAQGKFGATFSATFTNGTTTVALTNGRFTRVN